MQLRKYLLPRVTRVALGAAFSIGVGILAGPQAAHAQASNGAAFTSLYDFGAASSDGQYPSGGLVKGNGGNFYGADVSGGAHGDGVVFKITPSGSESTFYAFAGGADGSSPYVSPIVGSDGNLYGTTDGGGAHGDGIVYKITPSGTETVLYSFTGGSDGSEPDSSLVQGADGNFYGTTYSGGTNGTGTVYQITPSGALSTLYSFAGGYDASQPFLAALSEGADGDFYGVTSTGGANNVGAVYKVSASGAESVVYSFTNATDGSQPYGQLAMNSDGNLYGTTVNGGANGTGTAFQITPAGAFSTIYAFSADSGGNADGAYPYQGMIAGADGNLYGMTYEGGQSDLGTVFQLTPSGAETTLYSFQGTDGEYAYGNTLVEDGAGTFYGVSVGGGSSNYGSAFKLTVPASTPLGSGVRFDFNGDSHADLIWYNTASGDVATWDMDDQTVLSANPSSGSVAPSSGWQPVATTDVNGDGWPDLIWWNSNTGEMSDWTMANTSVVQYCSDFATLADTHWKPVAVADVSGNSYSIIFQNSATGDISRWTMQGPHVLGYGAAIASLGANSPWQIVGAPDLDADGKSDLLFWNNQTGEVSYWGCDLTGSQILSCNGDIAQVSDTSWHLAGSEDTDGDGHPDLIWWNSSTGELSRWLLNGAMVSSYGADFAQVSDTTWQPTAIR